MKHTIEEASKMVGKSVPSIYRHISKGKVSATVDHEGRKVIDTAELMRAYGSIENGENDEVRRVENENENGGLLAELVKEVKLLREQNQKQAEELAAIRKQLEERPLLEHKPAPEEPSPQPDKVSSTPPPANKKGRFTNPLLAAFAAEHPEMVK